MSLLFLAACTPLLPNTPPVASFFVDPAGGYAPLEIEVNPAASADPDGSIRCGSGTMATEVSRGRGATCRDVYDKDGVCTVELRARDDRGAETTTSADVRVLNPPPVVRVEAAPWYGPSPLAVMFDARESNDPSGEITAFAWGLGDGGTGSGRSIAHVYSALASTNYVPTLTVIDDDGARDSAVATPIIYLPPDVAFDGPTAEFSMTAPVQIYASDTLPDIPSLFLVTCDAAESLPSGGHHRIEYYLWRFGDGESETQDSAAPVEHTFAAAAAAKTFAVSLTVIDEQGLIGSCVRNVTVVN